MQGDIIGIVDKDSTVVARYSYDAWGKCTVDFIDLERTCGIDIANINPFRYRGYYFDREIGLYYLQSRYYDAEVGRFINGDSAEFATRRLKILEHNVFAYCENDTINKFDEAGYASYRLVAIGIQFEFNISMLTFGGELIFTINNGIKVYLFSYSGGSIGNDFISKMISIAKSASKDIKQVVKLFGASWSVCIMAIFSKKKTFNPSTYEGPSNEIYYIGPCPYWPVVSNKYFYSWFGNYNAVGYGLCSFGSDFGYSRVKYKNKTDKITGRIRELKKSFTGLYNKAKKYKRKK